MSSAWTNTTVPGKGILRCHQSSEGMRGWGRSCKLLAVARKSQLRSGSTNAVYPEVGDSAGEVPSLGA